MKQWKVVTILVALWLWVVLYVTHYMPSTTESAAASRTEQNLLKALEDLEKLRVQNQEMHQVIERLKENGPKNADSVKNLATRLERANQDLVQVSENKSSSLNFHVEKARRKAENTARELWYFLNAQLRKIIQDNNSVSYKASTMLEELTGYRRTMEDDFQKLRETNQGEQERQAMSADLGDLVQRRLHYLQNPPNCDSAKKVVCNLHKGCGFGCQIHHVAYCLIVAYAMQRTLILDSKGWRYSAKGWESVFQPLSQTCRYKGSGTKRSWGSSVQSMEKFQIIELPIVDSLHPRPEFMPLAIPADLEQELVTFHGDPSVWWIGQIVQYLFRPNTQLKEDIESTTKKMGFRNTIVGVHVRRTDKINLEAAYHALDEYMKHVQEFYDQLERQQTLKARRVYLASDDPSVLTEAKNKYPDYKFISDNLISKSAGLGTRYTDSSLRGIILDIHFLSRCDFLVCTFSSQVCRVAYEIMQTLHGDASQKFRSLDDVFYYGGQNAHNMRVVEPHPANGLGVMDMKPGDGIGIAGNHWDGYSKGINKRTGITGLYPSYKVENTVVAVSMPTYPEVPRKRNS